MARLVDGHDRVHQAGAWLGARRAMLGTFVALLHDSGYLKRASEANVENGAAFTTVHVSRSADFLLKYLPHIGFGAEAATAAQLVLFTGYELEVEDIQIADAKDRILGCKVGTSDLIGQMSDRMYLEKCRDFLYGEFVIGGIAREHLADGRELVRYQSPQDLIYKTPGSVENVASERIQRKLGSVGRFAEAHFGGRKLYIKKIDHHLAYLRDAIENGDLARLCRTCYSLPAHPRRAA